MPDFTGTPIKQNAKSFSLFLAFLAFFMINLSANNAHGTDSTHKKESANASAVETKNANEENAAGEGHSTNEPIGKQVSKMILGHIGDNHDWDAFGHAVVIPLPVILYTKSQGLQFFFSSKFHHGLEAHNGFKMVNEGAKIVWEDASKTEPIYDFSITKIAATLILGGFGLVFMLIWTAKAYKKRAGKGPKGLQNLLESLIIFIRDTVIKPSVGPRYEKFMPLLLTLFWFIFFLNLMGQIPFFPGGANASGNIAITLVLAFVVLWHVVAHANWHYWKHILWPDVPHGLKILMWPIEIMGFFLRPFVLMLRLFANITAGHIIILGFFSLIFIFGSMKTWVGLAVSPASVAFTIFMSFLELLVAFLQAYVFTLLASLYIGSAIEEHHHEEHDLAHSEKH